MVCLERSRLGIAPAASSAPSASGSCKGSNLSSVTGVPASSECSTSASNASRLHPATSDSALVGELSTLGGGLPAAAPAAAATGGPAIERVVLLLLKLHSTTPLAAACMAAEVTFASSSTLDTFTRLRLTEAEAEAEAEAATSTTRSSHSAGSDHMVRLRSAPRSEFLLVGRSCSRLCTQPCRFW